MDEKELLKERFKSAVSSTVKAISENFDLEIRFGNNISSKKNSLNLPEVASLKKLQDFTNLRAFADSEALKIKYTKLDLHYFQSNIEGELIEKIQEVGFEFDGIIINAAAYTHTSVGIGDAIRSVNSPVIEVHISNTYTREEFRHKSFLSAHVRGVILGFGLKSYDLAIESFLD